MSRAQLIRVAETHRAPVRFSLDGESATALEGDTVLTAVLACSGQLRRNEFSDQPRAGFCMMGACQDCWIVTADGERLRACSTPIRAGMQLLSGVRR
ncbi:(2Fe-2S)-binding protein [Herbaspirillum sp. alder98]|uniref:(2Fe-2S)-binding protein n=1 Tax=Herbaspirillum sp. alder98 TaxID=2913096 RepID=UPI001CD8D74B|nr:(2Fe-2S)-binding protein [Herbaspirillum sp. alder98]MCA1324453.1 (2Fe-2S)-binding protein [Herbaspirillum sp. alder98]